VDVDLGAGNPLRVWEQNSLSTLNPHAIYPPGQQIYVILPPQNTLIMPDDDTLPAVAPDVSAAEPAALAAARANI
jgi:hypothetical protein